MSNETALSDLCKLAVSPAGLVPFVGAGMSASLGFKDWKGFLLGLAATIGVEAKIRQMLDADQYEEAAQALLDELHENGFQDGFRAAFGELQLKGASIRGALALLPRLAKGPVITTNFDRALELAFEQAQTPFEQVIRGAELDTFDAALRLNLRYLLKVHGDVEDRTNRVLTRAEYQRHYGERESDPSAKPPLLRALLERVAQQGRLLFLGCSLNQDRTMDVLRYAAERYQCRTGFAVLAKPADDGKFHKKLQFLSQRGISPIWYPEGQHAFVEICLDWLAAEVASPQRSRGAWGETADRIEELLRSYSGVFAGREPELERLDKHIASGSRETFLVTAEAGCGKTALLARWMAREQGAAIVCHFFNEKFGLTRIADAYLNLLRQAYEALEVNTPLPAAGNEAELRSALYECFRGVTEKRPLIVLIDGLDEAESAFRPPFPLPLSKGLAAIVSARAAKDEWPERLWDWQSGAARFTLDRLPKTALGQWLRETGAGELARYAEDERFLSELARRTEGLPIYLRYLIPELLDAARKGQDVAPLLECSPKGFAGYIDEQVKRLTRSLAHDRRWQKLFGLLAAAVTELAGDDIERIIGVNDLEIAALPAKLGRWFSARPRPEGDTGYAFSHPLLGREFARAGLGGAQRVG